MYNEAPRLVFYNDVIWAPSITSTFYVCQQHPAKSWIFYNFAANSSAESESDHNNPTSPRVLPKINGHSKPKVALKPSSNGAFTAVSPSKSPAKDTKIHKGAYNADDQPIRPAYNADDQPIRSSYADSQQHKAYQPEEQLSSKDAKPARSSKSSDRPKSSRKDKSVRAHDGRPTRSKSLSSHDQDKTITCHQCQTAAKHSTSTSSQRRHKTPTPPMQPPGIPMITLCKDMVRQTVERLKGTCA